MGSDPKRDILLNSRLRRTGFTVKVLSLWRNSNLKQGETREMKLLFTFILARFETLREDA